MQEGLLSTLREAWEQGRLSGDEGWTLLQIASLADAEGVCWASNKWFATHGPGGMSTTKRRIAALIAKGWIMTNNKPGANRRLWLAPEPPAAEHKQLKTTPEKPGSKMTLGSKMSRASAQKCAEPRLKNEPTYTVRDTSKKKPSVAGATDSVSSKALKLGVRAPKLPDAEQLITPGDVTNSEKLREAILHAGHKLPRMNPGKPLRCEQWASDFRKLRDADGIDDDRVVSVLEVYCRNITHEFAPQAWSGRAFRAKFAAIERFTKMQSQTSVDGIKRPQSPEAIKFYAWEWPVSVDINSLEESVSAAKIVGESFRRALERAPQKSKTLGLFAEHLRETIPGPGAFVVQWHKWVLHNVEGWSEWSGSFKKFYATVEHRMLVKWVRSKSREFTNGTEMGDRFLKLMSEVCA